MFINTSNGIKLVSALLLLWAGSAWGSETPRHHVDQDRKPHKDRPRTHQGGEKVGHPRRGLHKHDRPWAKRPGHRERPAGRRGHRAGRLGQALNRRHDVYRGRLVVWLDEDQDRPGQRAHRRDRRHRQARRGDRPQEVWAVASEDFADEMDRVRAFLKEHFPERLRELRNFRRENPAGFRRRMEQILPRMRRMMDMLERNPETGELMLREERLGFQIQRFVDQYFGATNPERIGELRGRIRDLVEQQFEIRMELHEQEVRRLERRLDAIRTKLQHDRERRDDRIQQSMEDLGVFDD